MPKQRCSACGHEDWTEKLWFCLADEMWLCGKCVTFLGLVDTTPKCPRCHHGLIQERLVVVPSLTKIVTSS